MESRWRQWVADYQMALGNWRLCSGLVGSPGTLVVAYDEPTTVFGLWTVPVVPEQLPSHVVDLAIPADHPHYPYGLEVLPDVL